MNMLLGIATDDYVILSADKNLFAFGAINLTNGMFTFLLNGLILKNKLINFT